MEIDAEEFMATLLYELNKEGWGDIDPQWLSLDTTDEPENTENLKQVFTNTLKKFTDENI